jgi:hypothetical protein
LQQKFDVKLHDVVPPHWTTGPLQLPRLSQMSVMSLPSREFEGVTVPHAVLAGLCWQAPLSSQVLPLHGPVQGLSQQTLPLPLVAPTQYPFAH